MFSRKHLFKLKYLLCCVLGWCTSPAFLCRLESGIFTCWSFRLLNLQVLGHYRESITPSEIHVIWCCKWWVSIRWNLVTSHQYVYHYTWCFPALFLKENNWKELKSTDTETRTWQYAYGTWDTAFSKNSQSGIRRAYIQFFILNMPYNRVKTKN